MSSKVFIDLHAIEHNVGKILSVCRERGISVMAITKGVLAQENIVKTLIESGITEIGDARLDNLKKVRRLSSDIHLNLIRPPDRDEMEDTLSLVNCSFHSEYDTVKRLSDLCERHNRIHEIVLMIDLGDRREGVLPHGVDKLSGRISRLPNIRVRGVATNLGCVGGVCYTHDKMDQLCELAGIVENNLGYRLEVISGGSTNALNLLCQANLNRGINNLRVGTGLFLGDSQLGLKVKGLYKEAFILETEIIECKKKPSCPDGEIAMDAFGNVHRFHDRTERIRAILSIGRQDVNPEALKPFDKKMEFVGASSDHTIFDVTESPKRYSVGDRVKFNMNYSAMLYLMNSDYIEKVYLYRNRNI